MKTLPRKFEDVLVPVPVAPKKYAPIRSSDEARPYIGMYVKALHKWFVDSDLQAVVAAFCAERDCGTGGECCVGYGASEIGCEFPLYFMSTGTANKRRVGTVFYNGNVKLDDTLS